MTAWGQLSTFVRARQSGKWGQDSKLRPVPSELLIVGDHEVSPVVNDSAGNCSLAANQKPVRSTSWLHRSIPSRPIWVTAGMSEATSVGRGLVRGPSMLTNQTLIAAEQRDER